MPIVASRGGLCCLPCSMLQDNDHRVISLNDTDALDFELVEFRPKRRLRVVHILPWAYRKPNNARPLQKAASHSSPEDSGVSSSSSHSWMKNTTNEGEHPGNIWLYYERPLNYDAKLFRKMISPASLEKFAHDLSHRIIDQACQHAVCISDIITGIVPPQRSNKSADTKKLDTLTETGETVENETVNLPGAYAETEKPNSKKTWKNFVKNPFLIFIHDIGYSADIWKAQATYFSSIGYEILAIDLIGHGLSCVPLESSMYSFQEVTKDVVAVIDSYCLRSQHCVVIAHGYG